MRLEIKVSERHECQPSQNPIDVVMVVFKFVRSPHHPKFLMIQKRKRLRVALASAVRATSEFPALPLSTKLIAPSLLIAVDDVGRSLQILDRQSPPLQPKPRPRLSTLRQHLSLPPSLPLPLSPSHTPFHHISIPHADSALPWMRVL